jgi:hypothetical protein
MLHAEQIGRTTNDGIQVKLEPFECVSSPRVHTIEPKSDVGVNQVKLEAYAPVSAPSAHSMLASKESGLTDEAPSRLRKGVAHSRLNRVLPSTPLYRNVSKIVFRGGLGKLEQLGAALEVIGQLPENCGRPRIVAVGESYDGLSLGLAPVYGQGFGTSRQHYAGPNLSKACCEFFRQVNQTTAFTCVQLNEGTEARMHSDKGNTAPIDSYIIKFGNFTGGELWVYHPFGENFEEVDEDISGQWCIYFPRGAYIQGRLLDARNKMQEFCPAQPHKTMTLKSGSSKALILYTCDSGNRQVSRT